MLSKMQSVVGEINFNPHYEDSKIIYELYKLLVPPTINQNKSWVSLNGGGRERGRGEEERSGERMRERRERKGKEGGRKRREIILWCDSRFVNQFYRLWQH